MLIQTWGQVFSSSLQSVWLGFINFVPNLIVAIVVFVIGWVLGSVVGRAIAQVVSAYLPQVIIAALILILATVVADFIRKVVSGAARAAEVRGSNMVGTISYYAIWIFALIIALSTLGIAPQFMQILFTGIVAMLAIAGGLAFGLGGRDAAQKSIENISQNMK